MGQLFKLSNLKWMLLLLIPTSIFVACDDDDFEDPNYSVLLPNASFEVELGKGGDPFTVSFSSTSNEGDIHEWNKHYHHPAGPHLFPDRLSGVQTEEKSRRIGCNPGEDAERKKITT